MKNKLQISQRGIEMPESPIRKLAPFAYQAEDRGVKIYRLNIGQPDLPTPQRALDILKNIDRKILEYSPSQGYGSLRQALVGYYDRYQIKLTTDEIIITSGGSEAVLFAFMSCLNPGDEIIVPEPAYANYMSFAVSAGCSNNYGPYQFPEKLIPLFINNIRHRKPLPVYGKGENVRDWLYVVDHARAIDMIFHKGKVAETYNIGGFNEWKNIDIIKVVIKTVDRLLGRKEGEDLDLITYVTDRKGHDMRYAIDSRKLQKELGWEPSLQFEEGIEETVKWYLDNQEWMDNVTSGDYQKYYENMYKDR